MSGEEKKKEYPFNFNIIHGQNLILIKDYFLTFVVQGNRLCEAEGNERRPDSRSPGININFPLQYINIRLQPNPADLKVAIRFRPTDSSHLVSCPC